MPARVQTQVRLPRRVVAVATAVAGVLAAGALCGCVEIHRPRLLPRGPRHPRDVNWITAPMITTAYCSCQTCSGWEYNDEQEAVYASGPRKGKPKKVGITASGVHVHRGTIAADPRYFPFGTRMFIPGYGYGIVEDTGSAIKGRRLDLYFAEHRTAVEWGRRVKMVRILTYPHIQFPRQPRRSASADV